MPKKLLKVLKLVDHHPNDLGATRAISDLRLGIKNDQLWYRAENSECYPVPEGTNFRQIFVELE